MQITDFEKVYTPLPQETIDELTPLVSGGINKPEILLAKLEDVPITDWIPLVKEHIANNQIKDIGISLDDLFPPKKDDSVVIAQEEKESATDAVPGKPDTTTKEDVVVSSTLFSWADGSSLEKVTNNKKFCKKCCQIGNIAYNKGRNTSFDFDKKYSYIVVNDNKGVAHAMFCFDGNKLLMAVEKGGKKPKSALSIKGLKRYLRDNNMKVDINKMLLQSRNPELFYDRLN
jgi:hypothetical protein